MLIALNSLAILAVLRRLPLLMLLIHLNLHCVKCDLVRLVGREIVVLRVVLKMLMRVLEREEEGMRLDQGTLLEEMSMLLRSFYETLKSPKWKQILRVWVPVSISSVHLISVRYVGVRYNHRVYGPDGDTSGSQCYYKWKMPAGLGEPEGFTDSATRELRSLLPTVIF